MLPLSDDDMSTTDSNHRTGRKRHPGGSGDLVLVEAAVTSPGLGSVLDWCFPVKMILPDLPSDSCQAASKSTSYRTSFLRIHDHVIPGPTMNSVVSAAFLRLPSRIIPPACFADALFLLDSTPASPESASCPQQTVHPRSRIPCIKIESSPYGLDSPNA